MKIDKDSLINLDSIGVYKLTHRKTGKVYLGSTTQSFIIRFKQHYSDLMRGVHKNDHLQYAWNKHGEDAFTFSIVELCSRGACFDREQYWLDFLQVCEQTKGYNINPSATGTPNLSKETIAKRSVFIKETHSKAIEFYFKVKRKEITLEEVPDKYLKIVKYRLQTTPWNKGLLGDVVDYSYLKGIKKTMGEKYKEGRKSFSKFMRKRKGGVSVYNYKGDFIKEFPTLTDLIEFSKSKKNNLPLIVRSVSGRNNINPKELRPQNVCNVCTGRDKHYKGLIFRRSNSMIPVIPLIPSDVHFAWTEFKKENFI